MIEEIASAGNFIDYNFSDQHVLNLLAKEVCDATVDVNEKITFRVQNNRSVIKSLTEEGLFASFPFRSLFVFISVHVAFHQLFIFILLCLLPFCSHSIPFYF